MKPTKQKKSMINDPSFEPIVIHRENLLESSGGLFRQLPDEINLYILDFLDICRQARLKCVCKYLLLIVRPILPSIPIKHFVFLPTGKTKKRSMLAFYKLIIKLSHLGHIKIEDDDLKRFFLIRTDKNASSYNIILPPRAVVAIIVKKGASEEIKRSWIQYLQGCDLKCLITKNTGFGLVNNFTSSKAEIYFTDFELVNGQVTIMPPPNVEIYGGHARMGSSAKPSSTLKCFRKKPKISLNLHAQNTPDLKFW
jgi:hypothetical protein